MSILQKIYRLRCNSYFKNSAKLNSIILPNNVIQLFPTYPKKRI